LLSFCFRGEEKDGKGQKAQAKIWGVTHFNWVQYLIHAPADWTFTDGSTPVTLPMIDTWPTPNLVVSDDGCGMDAATRERMVSVLY
jgi:hypothetical protein